MVESVEEEYELVQAFCLHLQAESIIDFHTFGFHESQRLKFLCLFSKIIKNDTKDSNYDTVFLDITCFPRAYNPLYKNIKK